MPQREKKGKKKKELGKILLLSLSELLKAERVKNVLSFLFMLFWGFFFFLLCFLKDSFVTSFMEVSIRSHKSILKTLPLKHFLVSLFHS